MSPASKGLLALIAACTVWGLSPVLYRSLGPVSSSELVAHRAIWSLVLLGAIIGARGELSTLARQFTGKEAGLTVLAAVLIGVNWFAFVWAVMNGHAVEASLGYYIFPLMAVCLGSVLFRERLLPAQLFALVIAFLAVVLLTTGLGAAPWLALFLAITFAGYGAAKRSLVASPLVSVAAEVLVLLPLALAILWRLHTTGQGHFGSSLGLSLMLASTGFLTGIPLMLISYASRRVSMATYGLAQYLNPTIQFLAAVFWFGDAVSGWHLGALAMIWTAIAVFWRSAATRPAPV